MQNVLVILAHHDDEFFLAPLIHDECAGGARLEVCYLTHGSLYGADSSVRLQESHGVLAGLGVAEERIADLGRQQGIFDGELMNKAGAGLVALTACYGERRFARIYLMGWEGGHPDHDASHMIGAAFAADTQSGIRLLEFPAYNACGTPPGLFSSMLLVPRAGRVLQRVLTQREAEEYRQLTDAYASQQQVFKTLAGSIDWALFTRKSYLYRELDPKPDYTARPHAGRLFYEDKFKLSFETFRDRTSALRRV